MSELEKIRRKKLRDELAQLTIINCPVCKKLLSQYEVKIHKCLHCEAMERYIKETKLNEND